MLAFSTGRPCTVSKTCVWQLGPSVDGTRHTAQIREDLIELLIPQADKVPTAHLQNGEAAAPMPSPFVRFVRLLMICGKTA